MGNQMHSTQKQRLRRNTLLQKHPSELKKSSKYQGKRNEKGENNAFFTQEKYQFLFSSLPIPGAIFDATALLTEIKKISAASIEDFKDFLYKNPQIVKNLASKLRILDANPAALKISVAESKDQLTRDPETYLSFGFAPIFVDLFSLLAFGGTSTAGIFQAKTFEGQFKDNQYQWLLNSNGQIDYSQILLLMNEVTIQSKTEKKLQSAVEQLQIFQEIESKILEEDSAQAIAEIALESLLSIIPFLSAAVSLFDKNYQFSQLLAGLNTSRKPGDRSVLTNSPFLSKLTQGQSVIINDLTLPASKSPSLNAAVESGGQAMMIVPLCAREKTIGSINLISKSKNAFTEHEVNIVRQISNSIAIAIHKAELLKTERKARQEADILIEIAANINVQVNQDKLLDQILVQLAHVLPYDIASILQYKNSHLTATAHHGSIPFEKLKFLFNPIPHNLAKLIETQKPMIISDTEDYPNWKTIPGFEKSRSWLGVPLIAKGSFYGILMLDKWQPKFYDSHSANLAMAFGNQAAIAIENARLYHETQQFGEKMQQQVALRTRDLEALYDITEATSRFTDLQSILDKVLSKISTTLDCEQASVHLIDDSGEAIHLVSSIGYPPETEDFVRVMPIDHPLLRELYKNNEPIFIYSDQPDSFNLDAVLPPSVKNALGTPIRYKDKFLGVLGLVNKELPFTREEIALLTSITDQIGVAVENDRLRKQSEKAVITQERERLARDLHDSITQSLFSLTLFAAAASELLQIGSISDAENFLEDIATTSNQTHKEMRLFLYELHPSTLDDEGLVGALRLRLGAVENRSGIKATLNDKINDPIKPKIEGALFHVANEVLNNTLKHSQATIVKIIIETDINWVRMEIRDNGIGFNEKSNDHSTSMGMKSMQQRMASIDGHFRCYSAPGKGTTIIVSAPQSTNEPLNW